jgi:RNA recognition motif-containing protein
LRNFINYFINKLIYSSLEENKTTFVTYYKYVHMNIFVGSLPFSIEEADLRESFEAYGAVDSVKIITDKFTGRSKGFGFVEMPNDAEAQKAIDELNGATVQGRAIVVNKSEPKPEGERRSFNNNSRGGDSRGGYGGGNSRGGDNRGGGDRGGRY